MEERRFWKQPLAQWIRECVHLVPESMWRSPERYGQVELTLVELCDGLLLEALLCKAEQEAPSIQPMEHVDLPTQSMDPVDLPTKHGNKKDSRRRLWRLLQRLHSFYRVRLHRLVVDELPNLASIVGNPSCSEPQLNKFLLLLLGAAVHGPSKFAFIERIACMQHDQQTVLAQAINQVTENGDRVIEHPLPISVDSCTLLQRHLERVMKERDSYASCLIDIQHESDEGSSSATASSSVNGDKNDGLLISPLDRHSNVELASVKAELRRLRNQLEDKDELIAELRDNLARRESDLVKLSQEKLDLVRDARAANDYRDELDSMQHKLAQMDRIENDNVRLREKLHELEFLRSRVNELREENRLVQDSVSVLEEQLSAAQRRSVQHVEVEQRLLNAQSTLQIAQSDIQKDRSRIEQLLEENGRLERQLSSTLQKLNATERRLEDDFKQNIPFSSLQDQMAQPDRNRMIELQLENRKLTSQLENVSDLSQVSTALEQTEAELIIERQSNRTQSLRVAQLQAELDQLHEQQQQSSIIIDLLREDKDMVDRTLQEARRKFSQFQEDHVGEMKNNYQNRMNDLERQLASQRDEMELLNEQKRQSDIHLQKALEKMRQLEFDKEQQIEETIKMKTILKETENHVQWLNGEKSHLKDQLIEYEQKMEQLQLKMSNIENFTRQSSNLELEKVRQIALENESESKKWRQSFESESRRSQQLHDDLVVEKTKWTDLVRRLRTVILAFEAPMKMGNIDDDLTNNIESIAESVDVVIMNGMNELRREVDTLRMEKRNQTDRIVDLSDQVDRLRETEARSVSDSDERIHDLVVENRNVKEQVRILQNKIRDQQQELTIQAAELLTLQRECRDGQMKHDERQLLHNESAKLQVALRNAQFQEEVLRRDNVEMQKQMELSESARSQLLSDLESVQVMHQALLVDHDRLQTLHDMLSGDYDRAKDETMLLRNKSRQNTSINDEMNRVREEMNNERQRVSELTELLNQEREDKQVDLQAFAGLQSEFSLLRRNTEQLRSEKQTLSRSLDELQTEMKRLRLSEQSARLNQAQLVATVDELKQALSNKQLEMSKLQHKIEMLNHLRVTLEDECKTMSRQMDVLMKQNHELLARALNDKDQFHAEQKQFQEKLTALRRHKEKLEEKIMDQYKMMDNKRCNGKDKEKQTLVKRAAKALMPKTSSRRNAEKTTINNGSSPPGSSSSVEETISTLPLNNKNTESAVIEEEDLAGYSSFDDDSSPELLPMVNVHNNNNKMNDHGKKNSLSSEGSSHRSRSVTTTVSMHSNNNNSNNDYGSRNSNNDYGRHNSNRPRMRPVAIPEPPTNDAISLNGSERGVDISFGERLPPRPPLRQPMIRRSPCSSPNRSRPPPPYPIAAKPHRMPCGPPTLRHPPPPYPGRFVSSLNDSIVHLQTPTGLLTDFEPPLSSTPKSECSSHSSTVAVRDHVMDMGERSVKAMSIYENVQDLVVSQPTSKQHNDSSTVWYEYGCV